MKKNILLLLLSAFCISVAQAQCPDFTPKDTVCLSESFLQLPSGATTNGWDLCTGDIEAAGLLTGQNMGLLPNVSGTIDVIKVAENNGQWHGIAFSRGNKFYKLDFGNSITNTPSITDITTPALISNLNQPISARIVNDAGNWYVFIVNIGSPNYLKVSFGSSLLNPLNQVDILPLSNSNTPIDIIYKKENGIHKLLFIDFMGNNLRVASLGTDLQSNNYTSIFSTKITTSSSRITSIDVVNKCGNWYGFATGFANGELFLLEFGSSLDNVPTITNVTSNLPISLNQPQKSEIVYEGGKYWLFIQNRGISGTVKVDLGQEITDLSKWSAITVANTITNIQALDYVKNGSSHYLFTIDPTGQIDRYDIPEVSSCSLPSFVDSLQFGSSGRKVFETEITYATDIKQHYRDSIFILNDVVPGTGLTLPENIITFSQCTNQQTLFALSQQLQGADSITWTMHDNTTFQAPFFNKAYPIAGTYPYSVEVRSANGCVYSVDDSVVIYPPSLSNITSDFLAPTSSCTFDTVYFADASMPSNLVTRWLWDFGDSTFSTEQNVANVYNDLGAKTITLTAADSTGCGIAKSQTINMIPGPEVKIAEENLCIGEAVQFTDSTSFVVGTAFANRFWNFGDNSTLADTSRLANPVYTYPNTGTYTVTLTVENTEGCINTIQKTIRIYPQPTVTFQVPELSFTGDSLFFNSQTTSLYQTIDNWVWNFGDTTANDTFRVAKAFNIYNQEDTFTVSVIATTNQGCTDTASQQLFVQYPCPLVDFSVPATVPAATTFTATNQTLGQADYEWDFCSGDLKETPNTQLLYQLNSSFIKNPRQVEMVEDTNGLWYGFVLNFSNDITENKLSRIDFGNSPGNVLTPVSVTDLGNPSNILRNSTKTQILRYKNNWLGLTLNRTTDELIKITFNGVDDAAPQAASIGSVIDPIDFDVTEDNGKLYALVASTNPAASLSLLTLDTATTSFQTNLISNPPFNNLSSGFASVQLVKIVQRMVWLCSGCQPTATV